MSTITEERIERAVAELEKYADDLDAKGATPSGEDLEQLKNRMTEIKDAKTAHLADAEAKGEVAEAKAFLKQLGGGGETKEQPLLTVAGLPMDTQGKTFGELFVGSPAYADFKSRFAGRDGIIPQSVKGIQSASFQADSKALLTGASATSAGAAVRNDLYAPITDLVGERELTVRDLVTKGTTESDTVEYVRVTTKTNNAASTPEATTGANPAVYNTPNVDLREGYKPESALALEVVSTTVKTIAHWLPMTKRAASDAGQVRTLVDQFLRYGLDEELEDQMLNGAGTGELLTGIMTSSPLTVGSAGTDIDAVVDAIAAVRTTGRRKPTGLVINPSDWYSTGFLTAKDTQGNYIIGDPRASIEQLNTLWGLNVVVTEAQLVNTALIGDFRYAVLWEREGVSVMMSDQHSDYFVRNLLAILAEMRAAFGVLDPQAFCTITAV